MHLRYGPVMLREVHGERSSRTREQSSVSQMPTLAFICMTELIKRVLYFAMILWQLLHLFQVGHSENQDGNPSETPSLRESGEESRPAVFSTTGFLSESQCTVSE